MAVAVPAVLKDPHINPHGFTHQGPWVMEDRETYCLVICDARPYHFYSVPIVWSKKDNTTGTEAQRIDFCRALIHNGIESLTDYMTINNIPFADTVAILKQRTPFSAQGIIY